MYTGNFIGDLNTDFVLGTVRIRLEMWTLIGFMSHKLLT